MTDRSCRTCKQSREFFMADWKEPQHDLRCLRAGKTRAGETEDLDKIGRSCRFETDSLPEPQRGAGEKCGPARIHWEAVW